MEFARIGTWIDRSLSNAQNSWRGNEARKTIDRIMQRSTDSFGETLDRVTIRARQAGSNLTANYREFQEEHKDDGVFEKATAAAKQGGLIGMMLRQPATPPIQSQVSPNTSQFDGWNVSTKL